jgi:two-component sensor histidine kinase
MRTVLTIVRGCAAELGEEPSPVIRRKADELVAAVDRGLEMLEELMAVGRANRAPIGTVDLRHSLQQSEGLLAHLVPDGIDLRCKLPTAPLEVGLNRTNVIQIVMNLVTNAADAVGDRGSIEVAVREVYRHRATATPGLERCAVIAVSDTGAGMAVPDQGDVFDSGFTTKGPSHSGLGLTMVWQIAARAGGTVEIDSNPGIGTTVSVYIPLANVGRTPKRCVLRMTDERVLALISHEFDALGYEVAVFGEGTMGSIDADVAILDARHSSEAATGALTARVFQLDDEGPWRPPANPTDAADLVRRILMAAAARSN